jgi:hypothetical protein
VRLRLNPVRWLRAHVVTPAARRAGPGLALGLVLGLLALGPGLRRGFLLSYDMVFVPREPLSAALPGLAPPRAVPSDLVVAVASRVIPADVAQKLLLVSILILACAGLAALLEDEPLLARLAAGAYYAWNPYVAERLIIGQWALLLGYAGLPWVLRAVLAGRPGRLGLAVLPAVIGGFTALTVTALLAVPVALLTGRPRTAGLTAGVLAAGSLPWLIPSLLHPVVADPAGVAAFAARADTPFGSIGSLVMLGGIWNAQTVPAAYGGPWSALWLVIALGAVAGYVWLGGRSRWPGLGIAATVGLLIASAGVTAAGRDLLRAAMAAWPGFAVLRDGQQFAAPLALAEAAGFGLLVAWAARPPGTAIGLVALVAPVLLLPGLAWGAAGRLHPVWYPAGWLAAARAIDAAPGPGDVLLLPWAADRRFAWNGGDAMLDPWPRLLSRPVIWNDGTQVGDVRLAPDDPRAERLNAIVAGPAPLTAALRAAGVRFVLADAGPRPGSRLPGFTMVIDQPGLVVYELNRLARSPVAPSRLELVSVL